MTLLLRFIIALLAESVFSQKCRNTSFDEISGILHPKTKSGFLLTTTASRIQCAAKCEKKIGCWSFYHNPSDDECFLASRYQTVVPDTTYQDTSQNRFDLFRKSGGFSTCQQLLQSYPNATDGDYWLYPTSPLVHHNIVKLYCHNMSSGQPEEYLSLPEGNTGIYPEETYQKCILHVNYLSGCPGNDGVYNYTKIKVDPSTMEVIRTVRTFVTGTGVIRNYAWAGDCYSEVTEVSTCGPKGTFTVSTLGTGLKVDPNLTWIKSGYLAKVLMVRSEEGAVISLTCGGYPGNCTPQRKMYLHLNPTEAVDPVSATWKI